MRRFRLTPEALSDLQDIWERLSQASFDTADHTLEEFYRAFGSLAEMPGMGHKREDLTRQNVLFWPVGSYLAIYRPNSEPLLIVAVLHGRRNIKKILKKR